MTCKPTAVVEVDGNIRHFSSEEGHNTSIPAPIDEVLRMVKESNAERSEVTMKVTSEDTLLDILVDGESIGFYSVFAIAKVSKLRPPTLARTARCAALLSFDNQYALPLFKEQ